ncbi:MAG: DUF222 domain-containing protein [Candidatus Dormibacteraeota bacterium]|nr:DUF222 domain-containing protein [Candidatus Dormibacteraeota bacterium]
MGSTKAEISQRLDQGAALIVDALRESGCALDRGELSMSEVGDLLKQAFAGQNRIAAGVTSTIGSLDRAAETEPDHRRTLGLKPAEWLSHHCQMSSNTAYAKVQLARQLPTIPKVAEAFRRGEISSEHASVAARTVEMVMRAEGDWPQAETLLVQEARERDPRDLYRWGLSLVHQLAPQEVESLERRRIERRFLRITEAFEGGFDIAGYLDPVRGGKLTKAIGAVLGPRQKGDDRRPSQRQADGLTELAERVLDSGELPARGGQKPHLTITATLETLRADPGAPAALLDWGFPLSGKALREIAGDAELIPILCGKNGNPLYVGRKYRTATPKMRRALAARDRRCVWPGCRNLADDCDGHHADKPWCRGGGTNVDEMALLCASHHGKLDRGWRLERVLNHAGWVAHPPEPPGPVFGPAVHDPPPRAG